MPLLKLSADSRSTSEEGRRFHSMIVVRRQRLYLYWLMRVCIHVLELVGVSCTRGSVSGNQELVGYGYCLMDYPENDEKHRGCAAGV